MKNSVMREHRHRRDRNCMSAFEFFQAMDSIPVGLVMCKNDEVIFVNNAAQVIVRSYCNSYKLYAEDGEMLGEWNGVASLLKLTSGGTYWLADGKSDGHINCWFTLSIVALKNATIITILDITEHRATMLKLSSGERLFRGVFDNANDGIMLLAVDETNWASSVILEANELVCTMLGRQREEIIGYKVMELADLSAFPTDEMEMLNFKLEHFNIPYSRAHDGARLTFQVTSHRFTSGAKRYSVAIIRDVTEQLEVVKSLDAQMHMAQALVSISCMLSENAESVEDALLPVLELLCPVLTHGAAIYAVDMGAGNDAFAVLGSYGETAVMCGVDDAPEWYTGNIPHLVRLASNGKTVINPFFEFAEGEDNSSAMHAAVVPIFSGEVFEGFLHLWRQPSSAPFSEHDVQFAQDITHRIGLAISHARLTKELRTNRAKLEALSRRLVEVQEMDRRIIAKELHDEIGQSLFYLKLGLDMLSDTYRSDELSRLQQTASETLERVRELSLKLRPAMLDHLGIVSTLVWYIDGFEERTGLSVEFKQVVGGMRFSQEIELAAYRMVQEALNNVARHAGASSALVSLEFVDGSLRIRVEDDGKGFDVTRILTSVTSTGLDGMRERLVILGGQLRIMSAPGEGTVLIGTLPFGGGATCSE